jgi:alkanesulfonate monooxygenase SsuD/methylene tetrahydromethanopterin reductase-like flavin-dependent oxidoreductase (luciferase family)
MAEQAAALKAIWTRDAASFEGRFVRFGPIQQWPKPAQSPHPPILIGGEGPTVLDRVLAYGDGWIPNEHPELQGRIVELRRRAKEKGRSEPTVTVYAMPWSQAALEGYARIGVERCCFNLPAESRGEVERALDRLDGLRSCL